MRTFKSPASSTPNHPTRGGRCVNTSQLDLEVKHLDEFLKNRLRWINFTFSLSSLSSLFNWDIDLIADGSSEGFLSNLDSGESRVLQ